MTVKELIAHLQTLDPELRVFTKGYEGGFEDAHFNGAVRNFILDYHKQWWNGPHDEHERGDTKGIVL
jgi:hypothetical protein